MTISEYKLRAAEFRSHMEEPFGPDGNTVLAKKVSAYLPGGEGRSMKVRGPVSEEDLSHLNNKNWKTYQARGRRNGKKSARIKR